MIEYEHVMEIGAGDAASSDGLKWGGKAGIVTLYEPHLTLFADLCQAAAGMFNVHVHNAAVTSEFLDLYHIGYASYLRGRPSFLATSIEPDGEKWWEPLAREVTCQKVDRVDWGTVDYLILTTNGSEMDILPRLISRPKRIDTKHMCHNARHWEEFNKVHVWMTHRGYVGRRLSVNQHNTLTHISWTKT